MAFECRAGAYLAARAKAPLARLFPPPRQDRAIIGFDRIPGSTGVKLRNVDIVYDVARPLRTEPRQPGMSG